MAVAAAERSPWSWRALAPVAVAVVLALLPAPSGLPQHAWYYFAIFASVIVGLVLEPLPGAAIGLIAHHAMEHDLTLKAAAPQLGFVSEDDFDRVVDPRRMVHPYVATENRSA
jgi:NhaP-type Na+/H+ and K+/H+ antiporter